MKRRSLNDLREEMRAVARGEGKAPPRPAASLTQALTREALELLEMLIREHPGTIAEIAERTGRAQPNVSRSLQRLAALGLVRLNRKGREVTPEPIAGSLRIDLTTGTYEAQPLEAEAA